MVVSQTMSTCTPAAFARAKASAHARVVGRKPQDAGHQRLVGAVAGSGGGEGAVQGEDGAFGCSPKSFRAMEARAKAPAVCELDGPTMMGPIMSLRP